jgi:hypothetical protein
MSEEDREWLREIFKRSNLAATLGAEGAWTDEERHRWERLYDMHKLEYMQLVQEANELYGKKNTTTADEA